MSIGIVDSYPISGFNIFLLKCITPHMPCFCGSFDLTHKTYKVKCFFDQTSLKSPIIFYVKQTNKYAFTKYLPFDVSFATQNINENNITSYTSFETLSMCLLTMFFLAAFRSASICSFFLNGRASFHTEVEMPGLGFSRFPSQLGHGVLQILQMRFVGTTSLLSADKWWQ